MAKAKKLTKKEEQILLGLYNMYATKGDIIQIVGDSSSTRISDKDLMAIANAKIQGAYERFQKEIQSTVGKIGIQTELKILVKLT